MYTVTKLSYFYANLINIAAASAMWKTMLILMFLCIVALHCLSPSARSTTLEHKNHFKYGNSVYGYWLSYPGGECLKCNCSLNATVTAFDTVVINNYYSENVPYIAEVYTIFMNKSDCIGERSSFERKCYCYGNPDFLIGQVANDKFTGTMGDSNCLGAYYGYERGSGVFSVTCHGQKRSETMILPWF